ncbi:hypothetical protein QO034_21325 [Sedimentitalea sp. JM2-8]|uniref:Fluoride ion transporter CrcB n=1 Tax=Sedimentitalea xiamensis TaxID=3050037 RepID=A0ABT7FKI8_9RHOB|nr:hypothetical protein [Sedimentitalea xiamensis]MDK3075612.1 hypothetical protein [Sedimentitalea xiamensis]
MIIPLVLFGGFSGFLSALATLFAGESVWTALVVYSSVGLITVLLMCFGLCAALAVKSDQP